MNERIRELAVAAAPANSSIPHSEWNIPKEFIEKFAELIARECLETIQNQSMNSNDEWEDGLVFAQQAIKEHFGLDK